MKTTFTFSTILLLIIILLAPCGCSNGIKGSAAPNNPTQLAPEELPPYEVLTKEGFAYASLPRITAEELKLELESGKQIILIDTRNEFLFEMGHLNGAVNITYAINSPFPGEEDEMDRQLASLPDDISKVLYCS